MARRFYSREELEAVKRDEWALRSELEPAKHPGTGDRCKYVCPSCHRDGTCRVYRGNTAVWSCVACEDAGNIVDLYVKRDGMSAGDACLAVCERYAHGGQITPVKSDDLKVKKQSEPAISVSFARQSYEYCKRCAEKLWDGSKQSQKALDYLHERGYDDALIKRLRFGFDDKAMKKNRPGGFLPFGVMAVIIPYGRSMPYYVARLLPTKKPWLDADGKPIRMLNPRGGDGVEEPVYNSAALWAGYDVVFVVEGALDAAAITQAAATISTAKVGAVSINGAHNHGLILRLLTENHSGCRLMITLDSDDAGITGAMNLSHALTQIEQRHELIDTTKVWPMMDSDGHGCKDAGDVLRYYGVDGLAVAIEMVIDGTYLECQ